MVPEWLMFKKDLHAELSCKPEVRDAVKVPEAKPWDQSEKEFIGYLGLFNQEVYKFLVFSVYFFFVLLTNLANSLKALFSLG